MVPPTLAPELVPIRDLAERTRGLTLLLLFGSRGRGGTRPESDWDFAYQATEALDVDRLRLDLTRLLTTEHIDLVDLQRAGGLLRYRAARDGLLIYESEPGVFFRFWFDAVRFWLDAAPVIEAGYDVVLSKLDS